MRERRPLVSIIVPIYKVEKYLQQCVDSICGQTYSRLEIILIDDGSPDDCGKICDINAKIDSRISVIHKENGGLSSARNAGINIANGDYIAFVDSDDSIHPEFVYNLVRLCEEFDCDIAQCDFLSIAEDSVKLPVNRRETIKFYNRKKAMHELCCGNTPVQFSIICNKLFKKELFEIIRFPIGRINEDEFVIHLLLWEIKKMAVSNQYLYYYLRHTDSIMGKPFSLKRLDGLDAFRERSSFLKEKKLEKEYYGIRKKLFNLIEKDYKQLKKRTEEYDQIRSQLLEEKERILEEFPDILEKHREDLFEDPILKKPLFFDKLENNSRIVLYGAGKWGKLFYKYIKENNCGIIVGWVDNAWFVIDSTEYPIMPLDFLLRCLYDYVLITIKNKKTQSEVMENLASWGIPRQKILTIE